MQDLVQSLPYEEECPTVTSLPHDTEVYKYQEKKKGKLTIELTALQLFVIASRRNRLPLRRKPWKNPNN